MIPLYDIEYALKRETQERAASIRARDLSARIAHANLADRYADRAWSAREACCEAGDLKC